MPRRKIPEFVRQYNEPIHHSDVKLLLVCCYSLRAEIPDSSVTALTVTVSRRALAAAPANDRWLEDLKALRAA